MKSGIDLAVSYNMQVDHGFAQPLEFLLGGLDKVPVLPVFINGVATPLPGFQRTRMLGEAIGRFASSLNKRVLFLGSGGLSHQPPVPELANSSVINSTLPSYLSQPSIPSSITVSCILPSP